MVIMPFQQTCGPKVKLEGNDKICFSNVNFSFSRNCGAALVGE